MNALGLKLHPEQCNCGKCAPCPESKSGITIETLQRPEVSSSEWVEELAQKWERRASCMDRRQHKDWSEILMAAREVMVIRDLIKELRACAESSSTNQAQRPERQPE